MIRLIKVSLMLMLALLVFVNVIYAQDADPQAEPTNTPWPTPTNMPRSSSVTHGSIRGAIYVDANGDGSCVNTGVANEEPIEGVQIEFVSSDEKTVINHTTGNGGNYELASAGESYWRVTAKPNTNWVVTSENPLYVPIYPDTPIAEDINFCVQKATAVINPLSAPITANTTDAAVDNTLLPNSGAPQNNAGLTWLFFIGLVFLFVGLGFYWNESTSK